VAEANLVLIIPPLDIMWLGYLDFEAVELTICFIAPTALTAFIPFDFMVYGDVS
jgi:hypothetical protein